MAISRPKTYRPRPAEIERRWYHIDAADQTLGKLAVKVATILMGKDQPTFSPGLDSGSFVLISNAEKVRVTGRKAEKKVYRHHTGYIGGLREIPFEEMRVKKPERVIELAVRRMLPKTKLGRKMFGRLRVYVGDEGIRRHSAQKPETLTL